MANDRNHKSELSTWLGEEVRRARLAAGFKSQEALARKLGFERTVIAKIETGERPPSPEVASALLTLFPNLGKFDELAEIARKEHGIIPTWFEEWVEVEKAASVIKWWEPLLVPGLLQTPEYARALLGWGPDNGADLEERVSSRLDRQRVFDRGVPPEAWMLISESVFANFVGSKAIMIEQIEHITEVAQRPRFTVQIVPAAAGAYGGMSGAFAIADDAAHDTVVYLETGVQGMVVRDTKLVTRAVSMFDHLRAEADPRPHTLNFLAQAGERWNQ